MSLSGGNSIQEIFDSASTSNLRKKIKEDLITEYKKTYGNTANKMSSEFDTALNLASQLLGSPRGSIGGGMYNGGNYNYNNGWQNMSF